MGNTSDGITGRGGGPRFPSSCSITTTDPFLEDGPSHREGTLGTGSFRFPNLNRRPIEDRVLAEACVPNPEPQTETQSQGQRVACGPPAHRYNPCRCYSEWQWALDMPQPPHYKRRYSAPPSQSLKAQSDQDPPTGWSHSYHSLFEQTTVQANHTHCCLDKSVVGVPRFPGTWRRHGVDIDEVGQTNQYPPPASHARRCTLPKGATEKWHRQIPWLQKLRRNRSAYLGPARCAYKGQLRDRTWLGH